MSPEELKELLALTEEMELPEEQRIQLVHSVWKLMECVIDQAWGINPPNTSCGRLESYSLQSHHSCVSMNKPPHSDAHPPTQN